ncbi:hypothetical protein BKA65DRAFT_11791 [Rhexocercosporidium sp. MPI-PUGE-AT-0058]|nr:hypothetical protein BKA65DRAFT_11791 [Rhexocercosporidium sp. MPI-PUGE-AT-0058]
MMALGKEPLIDTLLLLFIIKDRCRRPAAIYNDYYDPFKPVRDDLKADYSLYSFGELLFNDRPAKASFLLKGFILSPSTSMLNRSWLWKVGYTLVQLAGNKKYTFWACKLLSRSLICKGRLPLIVTPPAQASSPVGESYEKIILFRQLEFRNAFTKWVILDDVKYRKASSKNLRRLFKIANI